MVILVVDNVGLVGGCNVDVLNMVVLDIGMLTVVLGSDVVALEVVVLVVDSVALETLLNLRYRSSVPRSVPSSRMLMKDA